MKLGQDKKTRIVKNALLSLLLYALPIILMFGTFYITGDRPWEGKQNQQHKKQISTKNKTLNAQPQIND